MLFTRVLDAKLDRGRWHDTSYFYSAEYSSSTCLGERLRVVFIGLTSTGQRFLECYALNQTFVCLLSACDRISIVLSECSSSKFLRRTLRHSLTCEVYHYRPPPLHVISDSRINVFRTSNRQAAIPVQQAMHRFILGQVPVPAASPVPCPTTQPPTFSTIPVLHSHGPLPPISPRMSSYLRLIISPLHLYASISLPYLTRQNVTSPTHVSLAHPISFRFLVESREVPVS